jgi:hypothetical protein
MQLGQKRDLRMARGNGYEILDNDIVRLREEQQQLWDALKVLFDLLEEYAPMWYTEEHHRQALSALEGTFKGCFE